MSSPNFTCVRSANPDEENDGAGSGDASNEITSHTVSASLSPLSADIDVPAAELVEAVGRHLRGEATAECAVRVLASQLMLGDVAGDEAFARAVCGAGEGGSEAPEEELLPAFSFDSGAGDGSATKDNVARATRSWATCCPSWSGTAPTTGR